MIVFLRKHDTLFYRVYEDQAKRYPSHSRSAIVESVEGKQLQRRVWGEIIDALKSQSSTVQGFA